MINRSSNLRTLVLGLGNVIMGDEGIGVHVVRALGQHALPQSVVCLDGGTGGFILLEPLQQADRIFLIDATADENPIGTVTRTTPKFSRDYPPTLTAHDIGVKDLLDAFYMQGGNRDVVLYAITIEIADTQTDGRIGIARRAVSVLIVQRFDDKSSRRFDIRRRGKGRRGGIRSSRNNRHSNCRSQTNRGGSGLLRHVVAKIRHVTVLSAIFKIRPVSSEKCISSDIHGSGDAAVTASLVPPVT